jgi:hypothetical protein
MARGKGDAVDCVKKSLRRRLSDENDIMGVEFDVMISHGGYDGLRDISSIDEILDWDRASSNKIPWSGIGASKIEAIAFAKPLIVPRKAETSFRVTSTSASKARSYHGLKCRRGVIFSNEVARSRDSTIDPQCVALRRNDTITAPACRNLVTSKPTKISAYCSAAGPPVPRKVAPATEVPTNCTRQPKRR